MNNWLYANNITWGSSSSSTTDYYPTNVVKYVLPTYEPATYYDPEKEKEDEAKKHVRAAFRWLDKRVSEVVDLGEILTMKTAVSL